MRELATLVASTGFTIEWNLALQYFLTLPWSITNHPVKWVLDCNSRSDLCGLARHFFTRDETHCTLHSSTNAFLQYSELLICVVAALNNWMPCLHAFQQWIMNVIGVLRWSRCDKYVMATHPKIHYPEGLELNPCSLFAWSWLAPPTSNGPSTTDDCTKKQEGYPRHGRMWTIRLRGYGAINIWSQSKAGFLSGVQGDPSGWQKPPIDLDLECSTSLPEHLVAAH